MIYEVRVSPELVQQWVTTGNEVSVRCTAGLPAGVELFHCAFRVGLGGEESVELCFRDKEQSGHQVFTPEYERVGFGGGGMKGDGR